MNDLKNVSYDVINYDHCPLDYVLEEIFKLGKLNMLTIGTGECAYFTSKQLFNSDQLNFSYLLEDKEIVFGDLSSLEESFSLLNKSKYYSIVVITCIPAIMNLNLDYYIDQYDKLILFNAPCFKKRNYQDLINDLYYKIFSKVDLKIESKKEILDYEEYDYDLFIKKISSNILIINNPCYLKLGKYIENKYHILLIDNSKINDLSFYKEYASLLNIDENEINEIENKLDKINKDREYKVNTRFDSLKEVVKKYGINIKLVNENNNSIIIDELDAFKSLIKFVRSAYAIK